MDDHADLGATLARQTLPGDFERWRVTLAPGAVRPTSGEEWTGAMVLVEQGSLEVDCKAGGTRSFGEGDLLVLGLLPLRRLRNVGQEPVRLLAVRRAGHRPRHPFLEVLRAHQPHACR